MRPRLRSAVVVGLVIGALGLLRAALLAVNERRYADLLGLLTGSDDRRS